MFTVIACVAVVAIVYWTDRLSDKETVGRPSVFDDDNNTADRCFRSPRPEIDRMGASCDPCHARRYCRQGTLIQMKLQRASSLGRETWSRTFSSYTCRS